MRKNNGNQFIYKMIVKIDIDGIHEHAKAYSLESETDSGFMISVGGKRKRISKRKINEVFIEKSENRISSTLWTNCITSNLLSSLYSNIQNELSSDCARIKKFLKNIEEKIGADPILSNLSQDRRNNYDEFNPLFKNKR